MHQTNDATHDTLADTLIHAIHNKTLGEICSGLVTNSIELDAAEVCQVKEGTQACERILSEAETLLANLLAEMAEMNITGSGHVTSKPYPQFHGLVISVPPDDLVETLRVASNHGFAIDQVLLDRIDAVIRCTGSLQVMTWHGSPVRLDIQWRQYGSWSRRLKKFQPGPSDFALVPLPRPFHFAYFVIRPLRIIAERLVGMRVADRLGLRAGSFSLGTPDPLILPLLEVAKLSENDVIYDLGCGDGRVLIEAAAKYGCQAKGFERNITLVEAARAEADRRGLTDKVHIIHGDAAKANFQEATKVFLFLPASKLRAIINLVKQSAAPGTLILAHEQAPIDIGIAATSRVPIISENGITVAHIWRC